MATTPYTLRLPTSTGNISIPQLGGSLTLNGRDSKMLVVDYPVGDSALLYSTAEVFTWKKFADKTVLVVYGSEGGLDELAVKRNAKNCKKGGKVTATVVEGSGVTIKSKCRSAVIQWQTTTERRIVQVGDLLIYILG